MFPDLRIGQNDDYSTAIIKSRELTKHICLIGSTGSGKTTTLTNFAHQMSIYPCAKVFIDPSGSFAKDVYSLSRNAIYISIDNPTFGLPIFNEKYDDDDNADIFTELINHVTNMLTENWKLTSRMRNRLAEATKLAIKKNGTVSVVSETK